MENLRKPLAEMTSKLFLAARDMVQHETEEDDDNLILCPFAVTAGVATMLYCGADGDAKTHLEHNLGYRELFMGHSGPKDVMMAFREAFAYLTKRHHHDATCTDESVQYFQKHFRFDFLQRLYIQEGTPVHDDFLKDVKKYLHVDHRFVDFAADPNEAMKIIQKEITEEVFEDVDTTVPAELLDMDYRGPRIFVANGGYFEGSWEVPFDRKLTYMGKFKTARGHIKDMEFMTITDRFAFTESEKFGALMFELPYLQNEASLLFLLPVDKKITRPGKKTGLCGLLERSDAHTWAMMLTQKRMKTLQVSIPKFAVQCTYGLEQLMMQTGFKEVMDDCSNRGRMATGEVRVSEGFHKAAIEIDENGTFVTGEMHDQSPLRTPGNPHSREHDVTRRRPVDTQKFKDEPVVVVVDQPFLIAVRHNKSGLFVLSGSIGNP